MKFETFRMKLAKHIRDLRLEKGFTQEDMDETEWAIPPKTYQLIEEAAGNPTLKTLFKVANRLKIPMKDLFDF
jgi:DNA-binding XRE family transcriptional regulator